MVVCHAVVVEGWMLLQYAPGCSRRRRCAIVVAVAVALVFVVVAVVAVVNVNVVVVAAVVDANHATINADSSPSLLPRQHPKRVGCVEPDRDILALRAHYHYDNDLSVARSTRKTQGCGGRAMVLSV